MKIRKANKTIPIINNQKDDKVVVDGFLTPSEIVERGKLAAQNTIETLKRLYPHAPKQKIEEMELIANEQLNKELRRLESENKENISAFYEKHKIKDQINTIRKDIINLNEKYKETQQINALYQKEQKIKELESIIENLKTK